MIRLFHRFGLLTPVLLVVACLSLFSYFSLQPEEMQVNVLQQNQLAGTYRCWSMNTGGIGGYCSGSSLILKKDGTYQISSEHGKYSFSGSKLKLSESKIRGDGSVSPDGMLITFSYSYGGKAQVITYLRTDYMGNGSVTLDLTLRYAKEDNALSWINVVQLIPKYQKSDDTTTYDALALMPNLKTIKAYFKQGVPRTVLNVYTSNGFGRELVGTIDLHEVTGKSTSRIINVQVKKATTTTEPASKTTTKPSTTTSTPSTNTTSPSSTTTTPSSQLPKCNPLIPKYSQPACQD